MNYKERMAENLKLVRMLQSTKLDTYAREVSSACQATIRVEGRTCINFISNSYMGFSTHPRVLEAVQKTVREYGVGIGGSPIACGTTVLHKQLCEKLARNYDKEAGIVFSTGYQALAGTIQGMLTRNDIAILDALCHRSIVDGCILAGCKVRSFKHNDVNDLEEVLAGTDRKDCHRMVIVDSVYSMDGDIAPLPEIAALCRKHGVTVMVDEAHSLGVMGEHGRGILEHFGEAPLADVVAGTFSKFAGAVGGFAAGDQDVIDHLRFFASPYVFSASLPPIVVAAVLAAFEVLETEPDWLARLWDNVHFVAAGLRAVGYDTGKSCTPVIPVMIRDTPKVLQMNRRLLDEGVYASPVVHPGVPLNQERLRLGVMATHTRDQLETAIGTFERVGRELGVIGG